MDTHAGLTGKYGDPQGEPGLRAELADYLRNSRGVICSPDQVIVGSGMAYSIGILAKLLTGKHVAVEEPGYHLVRDQFIWNEWETYSIPVGDRGISIDELTKGSYQAVYVTPSHQFPTGSIMPYTEREHLLQWAEAADAYIIEDDYDGEFRYLGKPIPSLQGLVKHGRVIYIGTFSKTLTPSLRMNYMVLPASIMNLLAELPHEALLFAPSRMDQWAMERFINEGHWYRHLRRVRNAYREKHQHLIEMIRRHLGEYVLITGQNAGLHIQLTILQHHSSGELVRLAAEAGVMVYDFQKAWPNLHPRHSHRYTLGLRVRHIPIWRLGFCA